MKAKTPDQIPTVDEIPKPPKKYGMLFVLLGIIAVALLVGLIAII